MRRSGSVRTLRGHLRVFALAAGLIMLTGVLPAAATASSEHRFTPCATTGSTMRARCFALIDRSSAAQQKPLGAKELRQAYEVPKGTSRTTVAVSIWHNEPHLEHDLNVYRHHFGLGSCTRADHCLRIVNQQGKTSPLPVTDYDVGVETTLDVSMISVTCPTCRILVVESDTNSLSSLAAGERTAVRLGATVVNNSYGAIEAPADSKYERSYVHRGVVTVASSGDSGFNQVSSPADYPGVVAVGGTELTRAPKTRRGWRDTAWTYGSSGCSAYFAKPAWEHQKLCPGRITADISGPAVDVDIYDSNAGGWFPVDGTSIAAPFVSGLYGLAGNSTTAVPADLYAHPKAFHDVTNGTNDSLEHGLACQHTRLCVAKPGYDAPTGLGTPDGITAF